MRVNSASGAEAIRGWWPLADFGVIVAFVLVGRDSHGEGNAIYDVVETAAPFAIGLVTGWLVVAGGRLAPLAVRAGVWTAAVTVVVGLATRRILFGESIAAPFVVVTIGVVSAGLVGWRVLALAWRRRRRSA